LDFVVRRFQILSKERTLTLGRFHGGLFVRTIVGITVLYFTFVFYVNPAAAAVVNEINQDDLRDKIVLEFPQPLLAVLGGVGGVIFVAIVLVTITVTFLILLATDLQLRAAGCPDGLRMPNALLILFSLLAGLVAGTVGQALVAGIAGWIYTSIVSSACSKYP
jgi:hypothetical protein